MKTSKKLENPCRSCRTEEDIEESIRTYERERFRPTPELDVDHLARFKRAVAQQVRDGWNLGDYPYFPTGNATESYSRMEGGSWNEEPFSRTCRVNSVISSGKERVVTLYSGHNSEILSPLHDALYASLQREGWLLVGSPTNEKVQALNGDGDYISIDYKSATDNIRAEYCRAVVSVLKEKSVGLTDEQTRCMDVLGELRFEDEGPCALRGQPMGSLLSFPVLCLINKACIDLSLADLALEGKITWKQFQAHRCLINGDDLLYREFINSRGILDGILRHGGLVGLVVNEEKTMVSTVLAEINSTLFENGRKQKKTNVSALMRRDEVSDPIGFLSDSICKPSVFRGLLRLWSRQIRQAWPKIVGPVPPKFLRELWRFRSELVVRPSLASQDMPNPFPVVTKPAGYDLTRGEEVCYISERVARLKRFKAQCMDLPCGASSFPYAKKNVRRSKTLISEEYVSISSVLRKNTQASSPDRVLKLLDDAWREMTKEKLIKEAAAVSCGVPDPAFADRGWVQNDGALAPIGFRIIQELKQFKIGRCATADAGLDGPGAGFGAGSRGDYDSESFVRFES